MRHTWLARCASRPAGASAAAVISRDGVDDGMLVAWESAEEPVPGAVKVDPRAIDRDGAAGWASLVFAPRGQWLLFDDPAVSRAMRAVLAGPPVDVVSTFVTGDDRFVGSLLALHDDPRRLADDPFALLFPAVLVQVGAGLLGSTPTPVGPGIQRYGAASPWPWDTFPPVDVDGG